MAERYSRQQLFKPIGDRGQEKIRNKHVLIVGAGALGSANAESFVRAGIGKLTIIDRDYVEWSNLQRQQLYSEQDVREKLPKAIAAKNRLEKLNSEVQIHAFVMDACVENLEGLLENVDVIIDATDNFDIRFIINDLSQKHNIPWVYGSCVGSYGMSYTIIPQETPCLHCVLKNVPVTGVTCDTAGIISPTVQIVAAYQVAEALKILVEDFAAIRKTFFMFDIWSNQNHFIKLGKIKTDDCPSCGLNRTYPYLSYENQTKVAVLCGRNTVQIRTVESRQYNFDDIEKVLNKLGKVDRNPYLLSCQLDEYRVVIFRDGRVFIHGTNDILKAKQLYYRVFG
ncbi:MULTISPECIES: molybdopterin-synthase adenylyltransferase MoeB [Bacillus cereus group]|jgi:adenylyltransferase/sulfurtransferase|uniref:molybdopterin-synthase adenylyltransferase MoeB n=1 Tax=Bacillus cereus group TaxID=86661 RepID=UPI000C3379E0|nr:MULTISPECIES: molybdopterin-synthase adenylyltransferase MoeB [Bacillus cereus group]AUD21724.1 thiamine biosynthesis protein MoeB [Bacillus sp. HBCD-sjtu]MDH8001935.1 molybdopterin-synthase adenylyltransferase MoeB [Bacillus cereus]NKW84645.1 molybdopterin-synthase adenylyltransferase MoeB [Bacillus cereus]HDR4392344.1 molybdopterin-synthase adenylyltransferase MoeB [Bacillus cereus]HDR4599882.1 molybdopterin-synthase adenylyltransferase MoeB [Bacillus cereus]